MNQVTIKDIAKYLSVSIATVSRALSGDKNIREETKRKVLEAAETLGYKPNPVALNLKFRRTNTVGVIVPEMVTPFFAQIIEGIQNILYAKGLKVIIAQSGENPEREKENLQLMEDFMVDGIIVGICHKDKNRDVFQRLIDKGIPLVFYDRIPNGIDVSKVIIDDYTKSFFMVEYLIRKGYKQIAQIKGPEYMQSSEVRFRGYKDALSKFKIPYNDSLVIRTKGMSFDDGEDAAKLLLINNILFDAVYAFTDTVAIGSMNYLREQGKRIPEDVGIAGFSGTALSKIVYPPLTTVEQPLIEMGERSAELVLEKINNPLVENRTIILDADIRIRDSV